MTRISNIFKSLLILTASIYLCSLVCASGCQTNDIQNKEQENIPSKSQNFPVHNSFSVEIIKNFSDSKTIKDIRNSGILKVGTLCDNKPFCYKNDYGAARGFEVDISKQIASILGVKLNIIDNQNKVHLTAHHISNNPDDEDFLIKYFFQPENTWICFRTDNDHQFHAAIQMIVDHLYETGAYQNIYKKWIGKRSSETGEN